MDGVSQPQLPAGGTCPTRAVTSWLLFWQSAGSELQINSRKSAWECWGFSQPFSVICLYQTVTRASSREGKMDREDGSHG